VNRAELVEQFGYDTKYAIHTLRLGHQGVEFLETGTPGRCASRFGAT
jgi:hypothetical protein